MLIVNTKCNYSRQFPSNWHYVMWSNLSTLDQLQKQKTFRSISVIPIFPRQSNSIWPMLIVYGWVRVKQLLVGKLAWW